MIHVLVAAPESSELSDNIGKAMTKWFGRNFDCYAEDDQVVVNFRPGYLPTFNDVLATSFSKMLKTNKVTVEIQGVKAGTAAFIFTPK